MKHAKSVFEAEARGRKVAALCRAIDHELRRTDNQPGNDSTGRPVSAAEVAKFLRARSEAWGWWSELTQRHGIRQPSALTIEAVCLEYEARAEEDAAREPSPELDEAVEAAFTDLEWSEP